MISKAGDNNTERATALEEALVAEDDDRTNLERRC